jgi:transglutaminase-like putative cysteine protease
MWLRTKCYLEFDITASTPFIFMLRPRSGAQQWLASEEYRHSPCVPINEFTDNYGNLCQRLIAPEGKFSICTTSEVLTSDTSDSHPGAPFIDIDMLPDSALCYLLPSRFCESDKLPNLAADITQGCLLGYDQVSAIEQWIRNNFRYEYYGSENLLSAYEIIQRGSGVCRDFAHLGIALCRSISIPARLVVGYLYELEPMDLHAWFEAYVGNRWYRFDATQAFRRGGYVAIGYGRDATDVAVFNQFGPASYPTTQQIEVELLSENIGKARMY